MLILANEESTPNVLGLPLDELIIGLIAFAIVYFLLAKFAFPNIKKTLEERTNAIEGGIARADEAQAEAQRTLDAYRSQLAEARHEASRLREEAREQGVAIIAEMREQAQAEAARITATAKAAIEADRAQALVQLRSEVGRIAVDLAGRVVGESLEDDARQRRTVDRFLSELEVDATAGEQVR